MKSIFPLVVVGIACLLPMSAGCGWFETSSEHANGKSTVSVAFNHEQFERDKADYQRQAEGRLLDMDAKLLALHAKAKNAAGDAKVRMDEAVIEQQANLEKARGELKEVQTATAEKWADVKARSSAAFDDLQKGVENAWSRFK